MAVIRTIEKSFEIGIIPVTGTILSLPDEYLIIPHLLYTSRKFDDYVISVIGPNGFFLISYQLFFNKNNESGFIEDSIIYLREYTVKLQEYFSARNIEIEAEPYLIIVVDQPYPYLEGNSDELEFVQVNHLKKVITSKKITSPLSKLKIEKIAISVKANGSFKRINQYQILMELDYQDDMVSYLAYDTILDMMVLVKEIKNFTDQTEIEDLEKNEVLREAKLTMQLQHNNIMSIQQIIPRESSLFIVMEYIDNAQSLRDFISSRDKCDADIAIKIIMELCDALEHAHSKGVVHRNIRPENILITGDLSVKLANFDLAKKLDMSTRSTFDLKQMIKENPYAAPELKLGSEGHHNIDQRVDVYSTGVILYELLAGRLPGHLDERYWEPPSLHNPDINREIDKILLKAIRFDPHQRFGTITALRNRLHLLGKPKDELNSEQRYVERQIFKRTRNSIIYQAFDKKLARKVVLKKVLLDAFLTTEQRKQKLEKLLAEAFIVSNLIHPNIVSVYDYFVEDGDGYIVMEWLEGKTLREIHNESNILDVNTIINIGIQIAEALNYAHYQNIMHKDIKPENVIFYKGKITILDFGLAGFLEDSNDHKGYGTAMYMAPEQLNSTSALDQRVDIFSLGVLLYEQLTFRYPYDVSVIMNKYSGENILEPVDPSEINYNCPPTLNSCIKKALKISPDERYQKIIDFIQELKKLQNRNNDMHLVMNSQKRSFPNLSLAGIAMFLIFLIFFVYGSIKLFQKDKKETLEVPNVTVSVPALPQKTLKTTPSVSGNDSEKWETGFSTSSNVRIKADLEVEYDLGITDIYLEVSNSSSDEVELLNQTDNPDILSIKDNLGNDYSPKVDIGSVSNELMRIYPNSDAKGYFILNAVPSPKAKYIYVKIKETEGKKRIFDITIKK